jgi:hypothetical protein
VMAFSSVDKGSSSLFRSSHGKLLNQPRLKLESQAVVFVPHDVRVYTSRIDEGSDDASTRRLRKMLVQFAEEQEANKLRSRISV